MRPGHICKISNKQKMPTKPISAFLAWPKYLHCIQFQFVWKISSYNLIGVTDLPLRFSMSLCCDQVANIFCSEASILF